jgi:hypothetical protein
MVVMKNILIAVLIVPANYIDEAARREPNCRIKSC